MLILIFALPGASRSQADDVLPPRFNFDRYSRMVDHSPFAIATAVALPSATPNFAKDVYVANAAHSPEGDLVTISIASIEWSDRVGATKVTISKDGNFATLTFNQALLSQPLSNVPPTPVPSQPNVAGRAAAMLPPSTPPLQAPRPHVRGVIQRNPKAVPMPAPNRSNL